MPNITKIKIGSVTYDIKDAEARKQMGYSPVNSLTNTSGRTDTTDAGITFTWNADKTVCTANGTTPVSGIPPAQYFDGSTTAMALMKAGRSYYVHCQSTSSRLRLGFYFYKNGEYLSSVSCGGDDYITVPDDATGVVALIMAQIGGYVLSNDKISDIAIFETIPNEMLREASESFNAVVRKAMANGSGMYCFEYTQGNVANVTADIFSQKDYIVTKDPVYFDNEFVGIQVRTGYIGFLYYIDQNGEYVSRQLNAGIHYFYGGKNIPVRFAISKTDSSAISILEADAVEIGKITGEESEDIGCGIKKHPTECAMHSAISSTYLYFYNSNTFCTSKPIKIPETGLRIGYTDKAHSTTYMDGEVFSYPYFRVVAVKKGDNGLTLQTDDPDLFAVSQSETRSPYSVYIPYIEDCYAIIVLDNNAEVDDLVYVSSGKVEKSFCGVYNIFPTALNVRTDMPGFTGENALNIFGNQSETYSYSSMLYYATVLRLRDVKKIVCSPKYTLLAEVFKANRDGTVTRYSDSWGTWYKTDSQSDSQSEVTTSGEFCIDFSGFDFDGFALVAIQSPVMYSAIDPDGYTFREMTTGGLGGYEDVKNSVCVEYKNGVVVSEVPGMPSIIDENIHKICNWKVPVYGDGFYVEQASTTPHYFPAQYDGVPSMYNGTYVANTLFMQVTAKSALTSLNNRNGRMRKMQRIEASQGTPSKGDIGYGITCTNMCSILRGLKENYTTSAMAYGENKKFERINFNYKTDLINLRPGDLLTRHNIVDEPVIGRIADAHCITVSSIVTVNGVVKAVNIIEATIPYCRFTTFVDEEYYADDENSIVQLHSIDKLADYKWINRIKPEYLKPIEKAFDMYPDSIESGTVMCDRGTDSIYGTHAQYIELSFNDSDVTTNLYLYKNGVQIATIAKSLAGTVNGLRLLNIASYVNGEGLYTVKTDKSTKVQETFYVKADVDKIFYHDNQQTIDLYIPNMSDFSWMEVWYDPDDENKKFRQGLTFVKADADDDDPPDVDVVPITETITVNVDNNGTESQVTITPEMDYGRISVPRYVQTPGCLVGLEVSSINRVYDTPYGTYWATINGRVSSDYYGVD